jgi:hypothetical protein
MVSCELGGARGGVGGHSLRVLQRAVALEVISDAGCAHRMIADARFDACLSRAPLNHPVAVLLRHAVRLAGKTSRGAKQGPILVVCNARRCETAYFSKNALVVSDLKLKAYNLSVSDAMWCDART